jgi:hypothetical protein
MSKPSITFNVSMNGRMAQDFDELAVGSNRVEIFKKSLALYKLLKRVSKKWISGDSVKYR